MPETSPSPPFEEWVRAAIVSRLPQPEPLSVSTLRSDVMAQASLTHVKRRLGSPRLAFALGVVIVLVSFGMLIVSPKAAAAVRHWLGFIPGLGLVEQGAAWQVLTEPVAQTRSGVVLTVEAGSSDADRTILLIEVDGMLPPLGAPSAGGMQACTGSPRLVAGGKSMEGLGQRQRVWSSGYTYRLVFPPLPAGKTEAELQIPCLLRVVPGMWPQDWVIPLSFRPGEGQPIEPAYEPRLAMDGAPATHLPSAAAGTVTSSTTPNPAQSSPFITYGISPELEGVVRELDGLLLFGSISWSGPPSLDIFVRPATVTLSEASGRDVAIEPSAPDELPAPGSQRMAWAFRASEVDTSGAMTLTFHGFLVDLSPGTDFDLALGPAPQPGQTWQIDRHISFEQFDLKILRAHLAQTDSGGVSLDLSLQSGSGVVSALIQDRDHPQYAGGGGGGVPRAGQEFTARVDYPDGLPTGALHLSLARVTVLLDEASTISWNGITP